MLRQRVKTLLILVPVAIAVLGFSHIPGVLNTAVAFLSITGIYEVYAAAKKTQSPVMIAWMLLALAFSFWEFDGYIVLLYVLFPAAVFFFLFKMNRLRKGKSKPESSVEVFFSACLIPCFFHALIALRRIKHGLFLLILMLVSCITTEMAGYFIGRAIGKHKLTPSISPNKTWEGSLGGVAVSLLLGLLLAGIYDSVAQSGLHYGCLCFYLLLSSVVGQFGDLAMSALKREAGIKDFGKILPGHGGILDRFDSQLFAAPFTLLFVVLFCPIVF